MSNEELKALINANIRSNGKGDITGRVLNSVLNAIADEIGTDSQYMGIADAGTIPVVGDTSAFYLATDPGNYTHFGNADVKGISLIRYTAGGWEVNYMGVEDLISDAVSPIQEQVDGKQDKIADLNTIRSGASGGATAYQKPSSGIPKTDLASAVQASLTKADTALQSHQSLDGYATETYVDAKVADVAYDIPTKVSELTNDSGYLTQHQSLDGYATETYVDAKVADVAYDIPTKVSELTNDSGYLTEHQSLKTINGQSVVGTGDIVIEGSGTTDYSDLTNKPSIGGVTLVGDKSASDLGLYTSAEAEELTQGVATTFMNYNQQNEDTFATKAQVGDNSDLSTAETTTIVGAINEVANYVAEVNEMATGNVNEIGNIYETIEAVKQEIPAKVGDLPNDMQYVTKDYVDNLIVSTINSAY